MPKNQPERIIDSPFVATQRGGGTTTAGGGGGLTVHDLDGPFHTGTLAWTSVNKTGSALADLATRPHSALTGIGPDDHHDQIHSIIGSDHTATGAQYSVVGLSATNTLGILASTDLGHANNNTLLRSSSSGGLRLAYLTAPLLDTASGDLALSPAGNVNVTTNLGFTGARTITSSGSNHLTLTPGGDLVLTNTKTFRSSDYADGIPIAGFSAHVNSGGNRQLTIHTIKADELHVRTFVADGVRIDVGEEYWGKSVGIVYENFTTPSLLNGTVAVKFEDSPMFTGALFSNSDWLMIAYIDVDTGFEAGQIWGQVSSYVDLGADINGIGHQQWTFTLRNGATSQPIKKGNVAIDFGASGQGYVHLSVLQSADGPWIQIGTWTGANPYTPGNRQIRTQIGLLTNISDAAFTPSGYGLYSDNAYLHGIVRTPNAILSDNGVVVFNASQTDYTDLDAYKFARDDESEYGGVYGYWNDATPDAQNVTLRIKESSDMTNTVRVLSSATGGSGSAVVMLEATHGSLSAAVTRMTIERSASVPSSIALQASSIGLVLNTPVSQFINVTGAIRPTLTDAYDLGTASLEWRTLYVNQIIAGSISGTAMSGATWTHPGNMVIDADPGGSTNSTVSITNSGSGTASLDVENNITLGGTVDGVDVFTHANDANAHHAQAHVLATGTALGPDHSISGAAAGQVLRALSATTAAFDQLQHDDLGGIGANDHHNQAHVLATGTALGPDHTISGAAAGQVLRALSATAAAFDVLDHDDLGNITANQHHNQAHVLATASALGPDHTVSGLTSGMVLKATSATAARFIALTHDELTGVTANQHHNQVHNIVGSDHTGTGSALQIVGFTATNTLGILTPSFDPGAAAAILRSTSAGGLTLQNLLVEGNLDVLNAGDLTVAGSGAYLGNTVLFVDSSGGNIGVMRNPDPQYALDVAGPIRGTYLIGKHAIQVKDAVMICHFDGHEPFASNYSGEANGHFGQVASFLPTEATSSVIFRPGIFGKAVEVAGSATNLVANPSLETNTTNWFVLNSATITRTQEEAYAGEWSLKVETSTTPGNNGATYLHTGQVTASTTYTLSMYVKGDSQAETVFLRARNHNDNANLATTSFVLAPEDDWRLVQCTFTTESGQTNLRFRLHDDAGVALTYYLDAVQVEQTAYATPYLDGSLNRDDGNTAHSWSGTAHASSSTRSAGRLSEPLETLPYGRGTVMCWARVPWGAQSTSRPGRSTYWHALNAYLRLGSTGQYQVLIHGASINAGTLSDTDWHHLALTWDAYIDRATLYVDGVSIGTTSGLVLAAYSDTALWVGCRAGGDQLDGWIDDFATISRELPAGEILSIFQSEAPIFAESSVFVFRVTPKGLVWADDEGLWMKDVFGNAVAGFYGGEAAEKSWGGTTLSTGDIFFGRYGGSDGAWFRFDRDGSASLPVITIGYSDKDVFTFTSTSAKLQEANLEIISAAGEVFGVFATTPPAGWGGIGAPAAGDVIIGDMDRGNVIFWDDSTARITIGSVNAGNSNLFLSATDIHLRNAGVNRISLTGDGGLTIRNFSGNAVFTFSSTVGAEFTLPLTLGTNGGIYQGTGTFASPTTGLKLFNSGGKGKLSGFDGGVEQITLDTDGKLKFGGGTGVADATGVAVARSTGTVGADANSYRFTSSGSTIGGLYAYTPVGNPIITLRQVVSSNSQITIFNDVSSPGTVSTISLSAANDTATTSIALQQSGATGTIGLTANSIDLNASVDISGSLGVTSTINAAGGLTVTGAVSVSTTLTAADVVVTDDLTVTDDVDINGLVDIAQTLTVHGLFTVNDNIDINGNSDISGTSSFGGAVTMLSTLGVNGVLSAGSGINVTGLLDVNGTADVSGVATFHDNVVLHTDNTLDNALEIQMPTNTISNSILVTYSGTAALTLDTWADESSFTLNSRALGNNQAGPQIRAGRNSSAGAAGGAAGTIGLVDANAVVWPIWVDNSGNLRINNTNPPTGDTGSATINGESAGTVVGTQTSSLDTKDVIGFGGAWDAAIQRLENAAQEAIVRFRYKSGAYQNEVFEGLVTDYAPYYGMDRDAAHPHGKSLNEINLFGDLIRAIALLKQKVERLERR